MFVDTHCHIFSEDYDVIDDVMNNCKNANISKIINSGTNMMTNKEALSLSEKYNDMYITLGIHPEFAENYKEEDLLFIKENIDNDKVVAIGEIGLDYHYEGYNKKKQIELLRKQLKIASEYNLPVVIHSRDATKDTIDILREYNVSGVIHSFSGSYETACIYINMGFLLGINGVITFKNCNLKDVIQRLDTSNFVLESDSPYLTPAPFRVEKNEPKHILDIARFVAEVKGMDIDSLAKITNENVKRVFDI